MNNFQDFPLKADLMSFCTLREGLNLRKVDRELNGVFKAYIHEIFENCVKEPASLGAVVSLAHLGKLPEDLHRVLFMAQVMGISNVLDSGLYRLQGMRPGLFKFEREMSFLGLIAHITEGLDLFSEENPLNIEVVDRVRESLMAVTEVMGSASREDMVSGSLAASLSSITQPLRVFFQERADVRALITHLPSVRTTRAIPSEIGFFTNLIDLGFLGTREPDEPTIAYHFLPREILNLTQLEELYLGNHAFHDFPSELAGLPHLLRLSLSNNFLTHIPEGEGFPVLNELDLSRNGFSEFPMQVVVRMPQLRTLNLADNHLEAIPSEIGNLALLEELNLSGNPFSALPEGLVRCEALRVLNLGDTPIERLSPELINLHLEELTIYGQEIPVHLIPTILRILSLPPHSSERAVLFALNELNVMASADVRQGVVARYNAHTGSSLASTWDVASEAPTEIDRRALALHVLQADRDRHSADTIWAD